MKRMTQSATKIQKNWRGMQTRENNEKVLDLKNEIRSLRTEEHIKYLTKELNGAKQALEQERKLRALQMDAIKVLWKEVQMMDATKTEDLSKTRPSGSFGSKISSRSSEHSIAKLMETLEATASKVSINGEDTETATVTERKVSDQGGEEKDIAVQRLGQTCQNLQDQVEQLQSSLNGMMRFMSAMNANMELMHQSSLRTRHSSSTSTTQDNSFQFYAGPGSLPPSMFTSVVEQSGNLQSGQESNHQFVSLPMNIKASEDLCSKSCTNLPTELTPTNQQNQDKKPFFLKTCDIPLNSEDESFSSSQTTASRPSSLPGLNQKQPKKRVTLTSPRAPSPVKEFANLLVEGLIRDSVVNKSEVSEGELSEETEKSSQSQLQQNQIEEGGTDISLSLAQEEDEATSASILRPPNKSPVEDVSQSSHVETDSLEENQIHSSPKKLASSKTSSAK